MVLVTATHRTAQAAMALLLATSLTAWAQGPASPAAPSAPAQAGPAAAAEPTAASTPAELLARAGQALADALASGEQPHPDQPAWRAAYLAAEDAVAAARDAGDDALTREALLVAARGYGLMEWHARAFASFDEYFTVGGELPGSPPPPPGVPDDAALFAHAANELGYARYVAGDHVGATGYYLTVLEVAPDDEEALRWLARIAFERGDAEGAEVAARLWERLLEVTPDDETARYYLERSRQRIAVGVAASDSFHAGVAEYEAGDLEGALQSFQTALTANPAFVEAEVWAGRVALELGLPELAAGHWRRVVASRPDDAGAAHFLAVAETQARYGVRAGSLYFEGLSAYEAGDLATASERFVAAAAANERFADAFVWAARSLQESGRATESVPYWERVLALDPADERAAWFLRRARLAEDRGDVAGPAFFDALAAYDAGDPERARRLLEEAVAAEPGFAEAWGYLGRIAFQQGRYADAAVAYERAAELAPAVGEYAFFAEEAMRLAGEAAAADDGGEAAETAPATPDAPPDAPPSPDGEGAEPSDAPPGDGAEGDDAPGPPAGDEGSPGAPSGDDADGDEPPDAPDGGPVLPLPPGDGGD